MIIRSPYIWWSLTALYLLVIFTLSSASSPGIGVLFPQQDKILHLIEYSIVGLLIAGSLISSGISKYALLAAGLLGSLYGVTDELHQYFVPGREMSMMDWVMDSCGSFAGAWLLTGVWGIRLSKNFRKIL
ncbi:MAG: VanZ family protein [Candidatus Wallbacteria bacterium]|nr:VanZ family protein [Candidatus Wallbacteria bacterium]